MKILVRNSDNTSSLRPPFPYDSWLEYWESKMEKINDEYFFPCFACGVWVSRSELDGCHVQKVDGPSGKMYIIPLCSACNHRKDVFWVNDDLLVPAP